MNQRHDPKVPGNQSLLSNLRREFPELLKDRTDEWVLVQYDEFSSGAAEGTFPEWIEGAPQ